MAYMYIYIYILINCVMSLSFFSHELFHWTHYNAFFYSSTLLTVPINRIQLNTTGKQNLIKVFNALDTVIVAAVQSSRSYRKPFKPIAISVRLCAKSIRPSVSKRYSSCRWKWFMRLTSASRGWLHRSCDYCFTIHGEYDSQLGLISWLLIKY